MEDMGTLVIKLPKRIKQLRQKEELLQDSSFVELVKKECELIRQHFSQEEIDKIELSTINGADVKKCIYGQMLGNCNHPKVANFIVDNLDTVCLEHQEEINTIDVKARSFQSLYTPLEHYISPTKVEEWALDDELNGELENKSELDNYYARIQQVYNWLKNI